MGSIIVGRPKAVIKTTITALADDPSTECAEFKDFIAELCARETWTRGEYALVIHLINKNGYDISAA